MNTSQIKCINKQHRDNPHERITHVGGSEAGPWKITQERAIQLIESRENEFFVMAGGHRVRVIVASRNGRKYLKTENDGDSPDNLLSLSECP